MLKLGLILTAPLVCSSIIFIQGSITLEIAEVFGRNNQAETQFNRLRR